MNGFTDAYDALPATTGTLVQATRLLNSKLYELKDHLGNVRAVISDKKVADVTGSTITKYKADITSATDYYSFGSPMSGRSFNPGDYRYGFNGQEKDNEIAGNGNSNTAEFWQYDTRLGRRWNVDPKPDVSISSYSAFKNNPMLYSDALGDTIVISIFSNAQNEDVIFKLASSQMVKERINDGVFIIAGHADPEGFENSSGKGEFNLATPQAIMTFLETNVPEWNDAKKAGKDITLVLAGCNTATDPEEYWGEENMKMEGYSKKSITQRTSEKYKDVTVKGADGYVQYGKLKEDRKGTIGTKGKHGVAGIRREAKNNGGWVTYKGGEKVRKTVVGKIMSVAKPKDKLK